MPSVDNLLSPLLLTIPLQLLAYHVAMLKNCDIPCLVFNDQFKLDQINIDNLIFSNKPSPEGWADVIKIALDKLNFNV